jgi:hypothetical protein
MALRKLQNTGGVVPRLMPGREAPMCVPRRARMVRGGTERSAGSYVCCSSRLALIALLRARAVNEMSCSNCGLCVRSPVRNVTVRERKLSREGALVSE